MLSVDEYISMVNHSITMALLVLSGIIDNDDMTLLVKLRINLVKSFTSMSRG